jgi:hypothetical protein
MAAAKARKEKMQQLDKERQAKMPKTEVDVFQEREKKGVLRHAEE